MVDSQSVVMDLLAGSEPVFFEERKAGMQESGLPFSLSDPYFYPEEDSLKQLEEENRLYQEKLAQGEGEEKGELPEEDTGTEEADKFVAAGEKSQFILWENYQDMDKLLQGFYTVDSTTVAVPELFRLDTLKELDCTIDKHGAGPQILIYHTHSQEGYADSIPGDKSTTVMGLGEILTKILTERYGFHVIHHTGEYDVENRDNAYAKAGPALEQILAENPSIEVVIDLHRDGVADTTRLVTEVNGTKMASIMFFNGLSRTTATGDIPYLYNPNLKDNLAFSLQMQLMAKQYYPNLVRPIYLKGYRYNMHYCPKSLLVEVGAQTNTVEEARNAMEPLADVLYRVLSGNE